MIKRWIIYVNIKFLCKPLFYGILRRLSTAMAENFVAVFHVYVLMMMDMFTKGMY